MLTSCYIEYHRTICLTLPRPTTFSLNRRLWNFLCNWAFMTCCEVLTRLRTLAVHENSADWDVHVDIWLWHGGENAFAWGPRSGTDLSWSFYNLPREVWFQMSAEMFCLCVCLFFVDIIGFMFFVCKGSNSRQTGETKVFHSVWPVDTNIFARKSTKLVAPFLDIIDNFVYVYIYTCDLSLYIYIYVIYIYIYSNVYIYIIIYTMRIIYYIYVYIACLCGDSSRTYSHLQFLM